MSMCGVCVRLELKGIKSIGWLVYELCNITQSEFSLVISTIFFYQLIVPIKEMRIVVLWHINIQFFMIKIVLPS